MGWMRRRDRNSNIRPSPEWQDKYIHRIGDAAVLQDIFEGLALDASDPESESESRKAASLARKALRKHIRRHFRIRRQDIKSIERVIAAWESENGALAPEARTDAWRKLNLPI